MVCVCVRVCVSLIMKFLVYFIKMFLIVARFNLIARGMVLFADFNKITIAVIIFKEKKMVSNNLMVSGVHEYGID